MDFLWSHQCIPQVGFQCNALVEHISELLWEGEGIDAIGSWFHAWFCGCFLERKSPGWWQGSFPFVTRCLQPSRGYLLNRVSVHWALTIFYSLPVLIWLCIWAYLFIGCSACMRFGASVYSQRIRCTNLCTVFSLYPMCCYFTRSW